MARAEVRYVYAKPMVVNVHGQQVSVAAGDPVSNPDEWGRSLHAHVEAGNILQLAVAESVADLSDDDLVAELNRRGNASAVSLADLTDDELLAEVAKRGLSEAVEAVEGNGAGGVAEDRGGVGADAPGSSPSTVTDTPESDANAGKGTGEDEGEQTDGEASDDNGETGEGDATDETPDATETKQPEA